MILWAVLSAITTTYLLPYSIGNVISFLAYFMLGYVLFEKDHIFKKNYLYPFIIIIIASITTCFRIYVSQIYAVDPYKAFFSPAVVLMSILVFDWFGKLKIQNMEFMRWLSDKAYYIYLLHSIVIYILLKVSDLLLISPIIKIVCVSIIGFMISLVLATIWDYFRKVLDRKYKIKQKITSD